MKSHESPDKTVDSAIRKVPDQANGLVIHGPQGARDGDVLTPEALAFVADLAHRFHPRLKELLKAREQRQGRFDSGALTDFRTDTRKVRESSWQVGPIPADLKDRRVEITGPTERKMIINALNSGAKVFMADFEESLAPTCENAVC